MFSVFRVTGELDTEDPIFKPKDKARKQEDLYKTPGSIDIDILYAQRDSNNVKALFHRRGLDMPQL